MNEIELIQQKIYEVKGKRVMFEVTPQERKASIEKQKLLKPSDNEDVTILRSQIATSSWGGSRYNSFAFTELGVAMLSSVLNSDIAIDKNIKIMRAFVEMRSFAQYVADNYQELHKEIGDLKNYIEEILEDQNDINEDHQAQLDAISVALSELQNDHNVLANRRQIGFRQ